MNGIRYIFSDIDGVLTDGKFEITSNGEERKKICYRDLDAIGIGRKAGLTFAFITGEDTLLARRIVARFGVESAVFGAKDKLAALKQLLTERGISAEEVCYVGDSDRDALAIAYAGIGISPADATKAARQAADFVTVSGGGTGVLFEVVEKIIANELYREEL